MSHGVVSYFSYLLPARSKWEPSTASAYPGEVPYTERAKSPNFFFFHIFKKSSEKKVRRQEQKFIVRILFCRIQCLNA